MDEDVVSANVPEELWEEVVCIEERLPCNAMDDQHVPTAEDIETTTVSVEGDTTTTTTTIVYGDGSRTVTTNKCTPATFVSVVSPKDVDTVTTTDTPARESTSTEKFDPTGALVECMSEYVLAPTVVTTTTSSRCEVASCTQAKVDGRKARSANVSAAGMAAIKLAASGVSSAPTNEVLPK
ncbi:hypothetical protein BGZ68_007215 [Mortierella alpina]|nr:hypothetical protein BGZ68_007215 [Mortierella alpina]